MQTHYELCTDGIIVHPSILTYKIWSFEVPVSDLFTNVEYVLFILRHCRSISVEGFLIYVVAMIPYMMGHSAPETPMLYPLRVLVMCFSSTLNFPRWSSNFILIIYVKRIYWRPLFYVFWPCLPLLLTTVSDRHYIHTYYPVGRCWDRASIHFLIFHKSKNNENTPIFIYLKLIIKKIPLVW